MTDKPDMISRAAVLALPYRLSPSLDADDGYYVSVDAIRALPAAQVADPAQIREAAQYRQLAAWLRNPWSKMDGVERGPIPEWQGALMFEAANVIEALIDTPQVHQHTASAVVS